MVRAQDIADAVGVSKTTVSYVFSPEREHLISEETRIRVRDAAKRLGYRPSIIGKALSRQCSYNVALVLPAHCAQNISQHLLGIFHGITTAAEASEYNVSVFFGAGRRLFDRLAERRQDGVLVLGLASRRDALDQLAAQGLPMVVLNREYPVSAKVGCVRSDLKRWLRDALDGLCRKGCRRILFLNKSEAQDAGRELAEPARAEAARLADFGVRLETAEMENDLYAQALRLLRRPLRHDGFLVNGGSGFRLLDAAQSLGLALEHDFHFSGFDSQTSGLRAGDLWQQDSRAIGAQGWQLLLELIAGRAEGREVLLPVTSANRPPTPASATSDFDL